MSVVVSPLSSSVVIRHQIGLTSAGAPIIRQKSLNNVRADAAEQDVYDVAKAIFSLSQYPVLQIILRKSFELRDDGMI